MDAWVGMLQKVKPGAGHGQRSCVFALHSRDPNLSFVSKVKELHTTMPFDVSK